MEISRGRGVSKAQFFKGKSGISWGVQGGGVKLKKKKNFRGRGMDIFWNNTFFEFNAMSAIIHQSVCSFAVSFSYIHVCS